MPKNVRTLTPQSTLESLKKEAKAWLKALRAGDPAARDRLLAVLPDSPPEPGLLVPGLRHVQLALAREFGLSGWAALREVLDDLALALRSHAELADLLLQSAKPWDSDKAGAARIFTRISARMPGLARHSLHAATLFGDLDEVNRRLAQDPAAAKQKGGPLDWEPILYLAYGRLPGAETHALEIASLLFDHGADPAARLVDDWDNPFTLLNGVIGHGEQGRAEHPLARELADMFIARGTDPFATQVLYDTSLDADDTRWLDYLWRQCEAHGGTARWHQAHHGLGGPQGFTTLDYLLGNAASSNHLARAEWLIVHGANPDTSNAYSRRPVLLEAHLRGYADMAALLLRRGATPVPLSGASAFVAAAMRRDFDEARRLAAGTPALLSDPSALILAAQRGFADVGAVLLDLGMPVDGGPGGKGPLHWAAQNGHPEVARLLIDAGAQVDKREQAFNGTPLGFAAHFDQAAMIALLAPLSRDVFNLAHAHSLARLDEVLGEEPTLVHSTNREGNPLICALPDDETVAMEVVEILIRHGADPTARNSKGETAAQAARKRGLDDAADVIEAAGG
jgi:ankyrin repeat protein